MQIQEGLEHFLLQLGADGRSVHTIGQYRRHVRLLARWLDSVEHSGDLRELGPEDLARFLTSPQARTTTEGKAKCAGSMNAQRGSLRGFFTYLHRAGRIGTDPSRLIRRARTGPPPPRGLSRGEEQKLRRVLDQPGSQEDTRDRNMFDLLLATGIRISAALSLRVDDIDFEGKTLLLRRTKGDRPQRVFLGQGILERLQHYVKGRDGWLFPGRSGEPITRRHAQRRLRQWCEQAGLPTAVKPHSLRHAFATRLYERTGDVLLVKEALGHRSIVSTLIYARLSEDRLRAALGAQALG